MQMLFVRDVAKLRGIPLSSARKWLAALEREHGARVVRRRGNRLWTTERALARLEPGSEESETETHGRQIRTLQRRADRADQRAIGDEARFCALVLRVEVLEAKLRHAGGSTENLARSTAPDSDRVPRS